MDLPLIGFNRPRSTTPAEISCLAYIVLALGLDAVAGSSSEVTRWYGLGLQLEFGNATTH
jgi:hypothetical protein